MSSVNHDLRRPAAVTFSFGRNWRSFSRFVSEDRLRGAQNDIVDWLGEGGVAGKTVLDIGCGSGIHSLGFHRLGAKSVLSLDVDPHSVACTRRFWERSGKPANWRVDQMSVLNAQRMAALGHFDIVYSWGVLHHTGQLWTAMDVASRLGNPGGRLWISIYTKGPEYPDHLSTKQRFNSASWLEKQRMLARHLRRLWRYEKSMGKSFREWFWPERGMNAYHDAVDWLGGLPYEVASVQEVTAFLAERGWMLERMLERCEGGCSVYLFRKSH
jgi:2-polyprenyl-6-hydroxyphenyl methylase/3-demethylubiquinone-9 3-methyltransferase